MDGIPGSFKLEASSFEGSGKQLYMGGNIEVACEVLEKMGDQQGARIQFFWKAKIWAPGVLERQLTNGKWRVCQFQSDCLRPPRFPGEENRFDCD